MRTPLFFILLSYAFATFAATPKPNIVFIMIDDLGPGWVDYDDSNPEVNTPNLQRLAETGMVFTRAYAAASICSPTRAACITGMSPAQIGMTTHIPGVANRERPGPKGGPRDAETLYHLPLELPSYARELKKLGYATGFIGKWHLAGTGSVKTKDGIVDAKWHPEQYGFDSNVGGCAYGQPKSWFDPYRNGTVKDRKKGEYLTDRLGDEAAAFIKANQDQPFHLTFWPYSVHTPIKAPKELVAKNGGSNYRAMLESMDKAVGKVLDTLEATGTLEQTMVVFYSDNGGHIPTKWLADKKASLLEGGLRVPMVVSWPGVIKAGTTTEVPVNTMDFFPTFVHAAGGNTDAIEQLEGLDLRPVFDAADTLERDALYWHFPHNRMEVKLYMGSVILEGDWKFYQSLGLKKDALFNLKDDPMETKNIIADHPERVTALRKKLNQWLEDVSAKMPKKNPKGAAIIPPVQPAPPAPAAAKPNVVIIFTDDQGYQDLGCYGSPDIKTPHLDQMAKEGMKFTSFYAQTVCGPSRAALLTGCYPMRTERAPHDKGAVPHPAMSLNEITIAELLKPLGYHTAMIGKWDLSGRKHKKDFRVELNPGNQGFDESFWTETSGDGPIRKGAEIAVAKPVRSTLTTRYTDEAISFIERNQDQPFFLYLAHVMPHTKLAVSKAFKGKSAGGLYGDVIEEIDHQVGRVLSRIKQLGLDENTYVIFMSDNGPWWKEGDHAGHCAPLRSAKTSTYEGGLRVPFIIRAPGKVPAGSHSDLVCAGLDLLPTIAALTGASVPGDRVIDGLDISGVFHGTQTELDRPFFYYQHQALRAVRRGDWKLHLPHSELDRTKEGKTWQGHVPTEDRSYITEFTLYNLTEDIGETTNVATEQPEVVERLLADLAFAKKDIGYHNTIGTNARRSY